MGQTAKVHAGKYVDVLMIKEAAASEGDANSKNVYAKTAPAEPLK